DVPFPRAGSQRHREARRHREGVSVVCATEEHGRTQATEEHGKTQIIRSMRELEEKQERLVRAVKESGLDGVLLAAHHNIAWLTGGRSNRVDASREIGTARLLVTVDGRRFVLGNAIEMPRLVGEVLDGLDFHPVGYAWADDQDP